MKVGPDPSAMLQAFQRLAGEEGIVKSGPGGEAGPVLAVGRTDDHREVQWVSSTGDAPTDAALDLFLDALRGRYGDAIGASVSGELMLDSGKPLEAREVALALEMAENHVGVYEGVNFLTQMQLSGSARTAGFQEVALQTGVDPNRLSGPELTRIDAAFQLAFEDAAKGNTHLVSEPEAAQLLRAVLLQFKSSSV